LNRRGRGGGLAGIAKERPSGPGEDSHVPRGLGRPRKGTSGAGEEGGEDGSQKKGGEGKESEELTHAIRSAEEAWKNPRKGREEKGKAPGGVGTGGGGARVFKTIHSARMKKKGKRKVGIQSVHTRKNRNGIINLKSWVPITRRKSESKKKKKRKEKKKFGGRNGQISPDRKGGWVAVRRGGGCL